VSAARSQTLLAWGIDPGRVEALAGDGVIG
jgi:hypothetical protein